MTNNTVSANTTVHICYNYN